VGVTEPADGRQAFRGTEVHAATPLGDPPRSRLSY